VLTLLCKIDIVTGAMKKNGKVYGKRYSEDEKAAILADWYENEDSPSGHKISVFSKLNGVSIATLMNWIDKDKTQTIQMRPALSVVEIAAAPEDSVTVPLLDKYGALARKLSEIRDHQECIERLKSEISGGVLAL
jgi:hypothetical protein